MLVPGSQPFGGALLGATLALAIPLAFAGPAHAATLSVSGPRHVTPGAIVSYAIRGYPPAQPVWLTVEPTRCGAPTCRSGDGNVAWLPDLHGKVRLTIRWPAASAEGRGGTVFATDQPGVRLVPWKRGALARVRVCAQRDEVGCASKLVRVLPALTGLP